MRVVRWMGMIVVAVCTARAGDIDSPAGPDDAGSAMHTLEDVYNRLNEGTPGAKRTGAFEEPVAGPGSSGHTVDEIMAKAPATNASAALAAEVLTGRNFWGLHSGAWGQQTGTMPNVGQQNLTPGTTAQTITQGYHDGTGEVAGDADLATGNIRAGVNIFGVMGKTEVVDTTSGDATADDILAARKAWVDGAEVTGSMATRTLSAANDTVQAGYYAATTLSAVDADLAAGNIKAGASIFGVDGTVVEPTGNATVGQVLTGATFSKAGAVGLTGTMPNVGQQNLTPGTTAQTITQGYHDGTGEVAGDADLATGNIRAGVNIFGVMGKTEVVDTTSGDAVAGDILSGKKAWVDGGEVTGTRPVAAVAKTGAGDLPSYTEVTGEDGHASMRKGVAWPNPRFTDNGDGTVTDNLTGLIWLRNARPFGDRTWTQALSDCATLGSGVQGLTDGSVAGDWRLPNVQELQSLIDYGWYSPALCNAAGTGQWTSGDPFSNVESQYTTSYFWSSTTCAGEIFHASAWLVDFRTGGVFYSGKSNEYMVWPVRGGE